MNHYLLIASGAVAAVSLGAFFLSTRPILFTRIFVAADERPLVRREILGNPRFERKMKTIGTIQLLIAIGLGVAAFLVGRF